MNTDNNNDSVLVISNECDFKKDLLRFVKEHDIQHAIIHNDDPWIRDYLIDGANHIYIRNKNSAYCQLNKYPDRRKPGPWDKQILYPKMSPASERHINNLLTDNTQSKSSNRTLEGGNLFVVNNKKNEPNCFISDDIIGTEQAFFMLKKKLCGKISKSRKEHILSRYKKIIGAPSIKLLPSTTFHLDMQMAYIGKHIFLVHSFKKMQQNFPEQYNIINEKYKRTYGISIINSKEPIIDNLCEILKKNNFIVKKICATLYDECHDMWDGKGCTSTFINGIALHSHKNNQDYFITNDSPDYHHKKYFKYIMQELNITPYFINIDNCSAKKTVDFISKNNGSIRCQTNFLTKDRLNHSNNQEIKCECKMM